MAKRWPAVVAAVCLVALLPGARASAAATFSLVGRTGEFAVFDLPRSVEMQNGGTDSSVSADRGRWEGVLLQRVTPLYRGAGHYIHLRPRYDWVCERQPCHRGEYFDLVSGVQKDSDDGSTFTYALPAGRYVAVLLGDPGARVAARFTFDELGESQTLETAGRTAVHAVAFDSVDEGSDREVSNRGFRGRTTAKGRFDGIIAAFDFDIPGAFERGLCLVATDPSPVDDTVARTRCADGGGGPGPPTVVIEGQQGWGRMYGLTGLPEWDADDPAYLGMGYDLAQQSTGASHISGMWWSMDLPVRPVMPKKQQPDRNAGRERSELPPTGTPGSRGAELVVAALVLALAVRGGARRCERTWPFPSRRPESVKR